MKKLRVIQMKDSYCNDIMVNLSLRLNKLERYSLEFTPWRSYPYKPSVQFSIAHNNDCVFLKYYVKEKFIRAAAGKINGAVWEDTCVEFFVSFDENNYYNLEFNCIGTMLVGFGKEKKDRQLIPDEAIQKIKYQTIIHNQSEDHIQWELTLAIPLNVFTYHQLSSLAGKQCRANFYKCGDALPEPHFVSWSNIEAPEPDFHLPEFFGTLIFE